MHDLVHMIDKAGDPADINYLFLGDYVDRGIYGMEVMFILLAIKVIYIQTFNILVNVSAKNRSSEGKPRK